MSTEQAKIRYQRVRPRRKTREEQFEDLTERIKKVNELMDSETDPRKVRQLQHISETLTLKWIGFYNKLMQE